MQNSIYVIVVIGLLWLSGCSVDDSQLVETDLPKETQAVELGANTVHIATYGEADSGVAFLNLHENEYTSVEATREVLRNRGGRLTMIEHSGERRVEFVVDADTFSFDPNRIYTDTGIQRTLEDENGNYSEEAHDLVRNFASELLDAYRFDEQPVVVTMHNNFLNGYSIESYVEGGSYESDAEDVFVNPEQDINDFYFVTDRRFFDYLRDRGYNVVLQDNEQVTDDGSLSVYSGYHGKPYINIEAGHGHHDAQVEMIGVMLEMFEELDIG